MPAMLACDAPYVPPSEAESARELAKLWRGLPHLSDTDALPLCEERKDIAVTAITFLMALGESPTAPEALSEVAIWAMDALVQITATGRNPKGCAAFLDALSFAVREFERLANEKPEIFEAEARDREAIPAMVSDNAEKMKDALDLAKKLHVAENYFLALKGAQFSLKNRSNALALQLLKELENARRKNPYVYRGSELHDKAASLKPLSEDTWPAWADVAWRELLDDGRHPGLYEEKTRICGPSNRDGGKKRVWPGDAKKALRESFRTLATGMTRKK